MSHFALFLFLLVFATSKLVAYIVLGLVFLFGFILTLSASLLLELAELGLQGSDFPGQLGEALFLGLD
jgi:hypothetical protein